jgi:hypothetical protein
VEVPAVIQHRIQFQRIAAAQAHGRYVLRGSEDATAGDGTPAIQEELHQLHRRRRTLQRIHERCVAGAIGGVNFRAVTQKLVHARRIPALGLAM